MDPEHTFIRVQDRFSRLLTPEVWAALEYIYLFIGITLFGVLVAMPANYVQQIMIGFSYLALGTAAAFMQHLILYFLNHLEVPALQRFMQNGGSQLQQHLDFHITSSTILASTVHITRLNTGNPNNTDMISGPGSRCGINQAMTANRPDTSVPEQSENNNPDRVANPVEIPRQPDFQQAETGPNPGTMNSLSSLLLWILGGASSEGLNSFLSVFRDVREQGQVYVDSL